MNSAAKLGSIFCVMSTLIVVGILRDWPIKFITGLQKLLCSEQDKRCSQRATTALSCVASLLVFFVVLYFVRFYNTKQLA